MPIHRLLRTTSFDPEAVAMIAGAYEDACRSLGLRERTDPLTEIVARTVIDIAQAGERNPIRLRERTLEALKVRGGGPSGAPRV
jgi:hypothetical protein